MIQRKKIKPKKCKNKDCRKEFIPMRPLQSLCSWECAAKKVMDLKARRNEKNIREERRILSKMKESLLTHADYLNMLQVVFNTFIRLRDQEQGCISCDRPFNEKYDAGHFYSVGGNANLRFNEDNVHGQCVECNKHRHGNLLEYQERLPIRIGQQRYNQLKIERQKISKPSIPDIKEKIIHYRSEIKKLKNKDHENN